MPEEKKFYDSSAETAVSGFQAIKKFRGLMMSMERVPPPENATYENPKDQIKVDFEEAVVLEMFPDADEIDFNEGKHTIWIPYAKKGQSKAHQFSTFQRCFVESSEELGEIETGKPRTDDNGKKILENLVAPSSRIGTYVTLEKQDRLLFKTSEKDKETGEKVEKENRSINPETGLPTNNSWCFVADEVLDSASVVEYLTELVAGKKEQVALRELTMDNRAKQFPEYKQAAKAGTLGDLLPVKLVDGKYELVGDDNG